MRSIVLGVNYNVDKYVPHKELQGLYREISHGNIHLEEISDSQLDIAKTIMRIMILYGHTDGLVEERPWTPVC